MFVVAAVAAAFATAAAAVAAALVAAVTAALAAVVTAALAAAVAASAAHAAVFVACSVFSKLSGSSHEAIHRHDNILINSFQLVSKLSYCSDRAKVIKRGVLGPWALKKGSLNKKWGPKVPEILTRKCGALHCILTWN